MECLVGCWAMQSSRGLLCGLHCAVGLPGAVYRGGLFPEVDAGPFRLHVRTPPGTRIEEAEQIFSRIEGRFASDSGKRNFTMVLDDIGIPNGSFNLAYGDGSLTDVQDGEIMVPLIKAPSTEGHRQQLRKVLNQKYSGYGLLFSGLGHCEPDPELRVAGADRRPDKRAAVPSRTTRSRRDQARHRQGTGRGGCAYQPGGVRSGASCSG